MAAAPAAVAAALQGFPVSFIPYYASDCQYDGRSYNCKNNNCTHVYQPLSCKTLRFLILYS